MARKQKTLKEYFALGNMSAVMVLKNFPLVLFVGFLLLVYIANAHYAEKKVRMIQGLEGEVKELRWHYISLKTELIRRTKRSELVDKVGQKGLKPLKGKSRKIVLKEDR
ncbi:MAG: FtsL-like putative cell division protein [Bacteroidota bacterium]